MSAIITDTLIHNSITMSRVLVIATSRKTRGGITSVIKAYETSQLWEKYHCVWIQTHRDGPALRKMWYFATAWLEFVFLLPFCDAVHIHSTGKTSAKRKKCFAQVARVFHKIVIVHFHPSGPEAVFSACSKRLVGGLFDLADLILVLSPQWMRWIKEAFPDSNYPMEVLWNPCPQINRRNELRKKQILFAATLCKRKGYDILLNAYGKIAQKYPDWRLVFAGNPYLLEGIDEMVDCKRIADALCIVHQVDFLGWVDGKEKERLFQESSIYCLASHSEGFPMGVLEAWAYGLPCVMTAVGGLTDVVQDGVNGLISPAGDVDILANQLKKMIDNVELRKSIVKETDKLVSSIFSIQAVSIRLDEIYNRLIKLRKNA